VKVEDLTLEEKASLCSGKDFWNLKGIERLGLPSIMVTDGPHGLRKQRGAADQLGINQSVPATCFPPACASGCSFDRKLLEEMGEAMGEECLQEQVSVILGPGANIKRSPLCGRNFEYFSEDPLLAGELAGALIKGVQKKGIGTSLKHYAANNQETRRMANDSLVDERALREIYLAAFERAIAIGDPWTVMCSYNLVNGVYASMNKKLLDDILRGQWGFKGLVMTDWGATANRVEGVKAGLDLEMPGSGGRNDALIVEAVRAGGLDEGALDKAAGRTVSLIEKGAAALNRTYRYDQEAHHELARKIAAASMVLLKNDGGILPLKAGKRVAVLGTFARQPRYQGSGSSKINPTRLDSPFEELLRLGVAAEYAAGYGDRGEADEALIAEAVGLAARSDSAVVFAGLPDPYESEGFDRESMEMPAGHNTLIEAVAAANPNTVVVLQLGSPVTLPWKDRVKAIVTAYLGGQAGGAAQAALLAGRVNPSGKLAETWPMALADTPCAPWYPGRHKTSEYRESLFVGYRYYDTAGVPVNYPFGHGLSYTSFAYSALRLDKTSLKAGESLALQVVVRNMGAVDGAETVQVYLIGPPEPAVFRAKKALCGFEKVFLKAGEEKTVSITIDARSFAYYNAPEACWAFESGEYIVAVGGSSADLPVSAPVQLAGDGREKALVSLRTAAADYFSLKKGALGGAAIGEAAFEAVLGRPIPPAERLPGEPFTLNSTIGELKDSPAGAQLYEQVLQAMSALFGGGADNGAARRMAEAMAGDLPLRSLAMFKPDLPVSALEAVVAAANAVRGTSQ
jgi:beta-glucosidase